MMVLFASVFFILSRNVPSHQISARSRENPIMLIPNIHVETRGIANIQQTENVQIAKTQLDLFLACVQSSVNGFSSRFSFASIEPRHEKIVFSFAVCENKDADQLRGNREADECLCFRYITSTIPLLSKSEISSL